MDDILGGVLDLLFGQLLVPPPTVLDVLVNMNAQSPLDGGAQLLTDTTPAHRGEELLGHVSVEPLGLLNIHPLLGHEQGVEHDQVVPGQSRPLHYLDQVGVDHTVEHLLDVEYPGVVTVDLNQCHLVVVRGEAGGLKVEPELRLLLQQWEGRGRVVQYNAMSINVILRHDPTEVDA